MNRRDTPLRISSVDIPLHSLDLFSGGEKKPGILWKPLLMMQLYVARYCTTISSQFTQRTQNNIPCLSRNWQPLTPAGAFIFTNELFNYYVWKSRQLKSLWFDVGCDGEGKIEGIQKLIWQCWIFLKYCFYLFYSSRRSKSWNSNNDWKSKLLQRSLL